MTQSIAESDYPTILVVDDNPAALCVKSRLLGRQGYRIIEADNGTDALVVAAAERPALILLDVNLSDISGFDVCQRLKTQPETKSIKILQTSAARVHAPDRVKSLEVGADAYLVEPAEEEELLGTVRALLALAKHERDNQRLIARLTESEARYRSLIEHMPAAMYAIDREGRITFYNDQAAELWGRRPNLDDSECRFCGSHKLLWPDGTTLPHDKTPMVDALQNGTALHGQEVIIERSDGTRRHVIVHIDPLRNAEGHIVGAVNLFTDITARKEVEDALGKSEERFRMLAEAIPHFVWRTDEQGEPEFENQQWYDYTGLTHETTKQGGWLTVQHPDDAPRLADTWKKAVETGGEYDVETRCRRAIDGTYRWFRVRAAPVRDAGGRIQSWVGTCTDIHDRKEAELALRESEERYRATFANAPVGISHIGLDGRWLRFNDALCAITGYFREELLTRTFADITYPGDLKAEWAQTRRALTGKIDTYSLEKRYIRKDGSPVWVHKTVSLLRDAHHRPLHFISIIEDIDDRKQAEEALREAQARLQRWNVELEQAVNKKTAELRQSQDRLRALTSELNLAEQRERKRLATELHDHLQQMLVVGKLTIGQGKRSASGVPACESVLKKVDDILSDALTYSRTLVAELSPPVLRDHGLAASLNWLAEYMKAKHEQTVTVVVPEDQGLDLPEEQRLLLFQSVRELLINSAKHAGTGQAALTMEIRADHLCITVNDEGAGFDLAAAAAVGTPSDEISSRFGLYSIQERMRALGGSFTIDSAPGHGTIATLILPLAKSARDNQPPPPGAAFEGVCAPVHADGTASLAKRRMAVPVLLVDDHAMVREGLRSVLDAYADIQVVGEAHDGVEAVKLVEKLRPRAVVMDINLPKLNGIDATAQIKTKWPETTVIGISVNIGGDNSDAMYRAGAATLLTKDAAVEQLHDTIVQAVGSQDREGGPVIPSEISSRSL
ncbi:MAG: PAS domain S-box protein [Nitrospira sp. LK70]|nr:PAS domain S-box protein [Nitrospira sp. LK70]